MTDPKYGRALVILNLGVTATWGEDGGKQRTLTGIEKLFGVDTKAGVSPDTGCAHLQSAVIQYETSKEGTEFIRNTVESMRKEFPIVPPRTAEKLGCLLESWLGEENGPGFEALVAEIIRLVEYDELPERLRPVSALPDAGLEELAADISAGVYDAPGEATQHFPAVPAEAIPQTHYFASSGMSHPDHGEMSCEEFEGRVAAAKQGEAEFKVDLSVPAPPQDIPHHTWWDEKSKSWVGHPGHLGMYCEDFTPSYRDTSHKYEDLPDGAPHPGHAGISCLDFEEYANGEEYCRPGAHIATKGNTEHVCVLPVAKPAVTEGSEG
jgi:hypothetical protein